MPWSVFTESEQKSQGGRSKFVLNCEYPSRLCDEGKMCVTVDQLCDNHPDCADKSDEGGQCGKDPVLLFNVLENGKRAGV